MELWVPGSSSCEQTSSSKIDAFSSVVAVTGGPLPLRRSVDPVPSILFDQVMNCHAGTFKTRMLLPDFLCAPTFFIKIFFNDSLLFVG